MAAVSECVLTEAAWQQGILEELQRLRLFGDVPASELTCLVAEATESHIAADTKIVDETERFDNFLILLDGKVSVSRSDGQGNFLINKVMSAPSFMGEVPLLSGLPSYMTVQTVTPTRGLRLTEAAFWSVLARTPRLRAAIIAEMSMRVRGMQAQQTQQDKMALLGTMTAGLMHELNNPGSAARRAASQLRVNLQRMHMLARSFSERGHTAEQRSCLTALQERALAVRADVCLSSLQQSDAEEAMGEWMDAHAVAKAWEFAPVLVSSGISSDDLECLAAAFTGASLTEPIEWLEATASSMQMVGLVEDSVSRVVELAQAVKSYAHEGQGGMQDLDINKSIHTTMVMLKHKLREKNIRVVKDFGAGIPNLHCVCSGLNQVWTNLLDNSIDAVPVGGTIAVHTSFLDNEVRIAFRDNGPGISPEDQEHIFDPFFTTKEAGVGSGLGLGIVRRILESYQGRLTLESKPGTTEFTVHLPATRD
ncbi:MAG: sensor histidine kinase [Janthinobacterium lividum]